MQLISRLGLASNSATNPETLAAQMHDYAERGLALGPQRLLIVAAALLLQAFYINAVFAAISLMLIIMAEVFDGRSFALARQARAHDPAQLRAILRRLHIGALFGASVVSFFALSLALARTGTPYFLPMFFLIATAVFAAMNTHQLVSVMVIRLSVYSVTFLAIPLIDLIVAGALPSRETWINLATSLFVLYFIVDCSVVGLRYYRTNSRQLAQLTVENNRAKAALAAKTEFLSTVSHELRTPLTSIRASLDMALAGAFGPLPDKSAGVLGIAQRNAHRLGVLIDELLDLQKMEVGKMKFDYCDVSLSEIVGAAVADNTAYARELDVTLVMRPVERDIYVRADPMRLEQVITNLLSNAAKFSEAGSEVGVDISATSDQVRISVRDHGAGIDPADHDRIFDSFSQLDNTDSRKFSGTGLGLNISKRIVEAHGGLISFEPNTGGGTVFFVELARITPQGTIGGPHSPPEAIRAA